MKKKTLIIVLLVLSVLAAMVIYRINSNKEKDAKNSGPRAGGRAAAKVYGKVIQGQEFSDFLTLSGSIEADEQIELHTEISGIVESINFSEGGRVGQGQVLITLNDAELQAQLAQAKTRNNLAAENERRAKLLLEKEAISQEEYDIASADFRTAQSQIQLIQAQLSKTVIRAPFSGTIGLRNISKGSYITPATSIAKLVNTSRLKVSFSIPEKYANKVRVGNQIKFDVQGVDADFSAKIYATEPSVEANTRTLLVKAISANSGNQLIPGTFANIVFPLETIDNGLLVPAEALIPIQNGKKVFVMRKGLATEVLVETGARTEEDILITSGISAGDTVLTSGVMALRNGTPVNVTLR
ncbi:efflux RND transporter periplasmic adaptor subunit [Sphingobacterium sp. DK4209]|uniref:Efflux RND transporter periplasmic adaptor subunit n=1 Tax=Sphingobacterium zhuxiongii TaxID=2662364 RepID=A0A5Q0QEF5_9SPHI|nr:MULTISPECIES: efflux RND transporter periplasmic adaptor subunit [unclassified Sphingobacterium]MVZ67648.1 efflux RND transporter periplasmic adaptor subunit [Sphingobacterium sp. DK4209]QGA27654.1 efflux RND transporter periplasmic adaptor subunit [Sphingobacterium sp. dk4302]